MLTADVATVTTTDRSLLESVRRTLAESDDALRCVALVHAHGELTNETLLNHLRVHRSSAVCALLARLPGVEPLPGGVVGVRRAASRPA